MRLPLALAISLATPFAGIESQSKTQPSKSASPPTSTQPDRQPTLAECDLLADLISDLPAWTEAGTLSQNEGRTLARTAAAFQSLGTGNMAQVLVKYMDKYGKGLPEQMDDPDPRTKPLLLLASMFDLSEPTTYDMDALHADRSTRGVQICGGFFYQQLSRQNLPDLERFALPLSWTEDGPKLTAVRVAHVRGQIGGPPRGRYQPWTEFHHFVRFYSHRKSFPPYFMESGPSWRELVEERSARNAASQPQVR